MVLFDSSYLNINCPHPKLHWTSLDTTKKKHTVLQKYFILQLTPTHPASLLQTAGNTVVTTSDALLLPESNSLAVHVI